MLSQQKKDKDFAVIPLLLAKDIPGLPFLEGIASVDFRDPDKYRKSFYRLVCALQNQAPGPVIELPCEPRLPGQSSVAPCFYCKDEISFVEDLIQSLSSLQAVLLLAQVDRWTGAFKQLLLEHAQREYGEKNILYLQVPFGQHSDLSDCYAWMGKQCGFPKAISSSFGLMQAIQDRSLANTGLFLMVNGMEYGCTEIQTELAGIFRSLNEHPGSKLKILIYGEEKLADLAYKGSLSYLNQSKIIEAPELTANDVLALARDVWPCPKHRKPGPALDGTSAKRLLDLSGGHPRLLRLCFELWARDSRFTVEDLTAHLLHSPIAWQLFFPFCRDSGQRQQVYELAGQLDAGSVLLSFYDPLFKRLYWKNLLKKSGNDRRLYWRCEALLLCGRHILAEGK